jgi:hypothetical protein
MRFTRELRKIVRGAQPAQQLRVRTRCNSAVSAKPSEKVLQTACPEGHCAMSLARGACSTELSSLAGSWSQAATTDASSVSHKSPVQEYLFKQATCPHQVGPLKQGPGTTSRLCSKIVNVHGQHTQTSHRSPPDTSQTCHRQGGLNTVLAGSAATWMGGIKQSRP